MLRTSSYTIYVDLPGNTEEMLLVHGYTGAYDRISRRAATFVRSLERRRPPKPLYGDWSPEPSADGQVTSPSDATVEALKRRGYLTEMSPEEEEAHFVQLANDLHERAVHKMPSYIFMPTYDCNLRCAYCFQDHMRTDSGFTHLLRTIQPAMVDRIFAALPQIEAMHGIEGESPRHRNIGFFGGEPLLKASRPIVQYIIEKAHSMGTAEFWAVSNATELEAYRDLLGPDGITSVQITLDGPPEEHDKRRIRADGSGTYQKIAENISLALEQGISVSVRLNIDRHNILQLPILAADFQARGWHQKTNFSAYVAPLRAENKKTDARTTFDTWELDQSLAEMQEADPDLRIFGRADDGIKRNARKIFAKSRAAISSYRESFCSAHTRMYIFDAFADIYACWERTGDAKVRIGHVDAAGEVSLNTTVNTLWRSRTVVSNPACRKCRYALSCGGGCAVLAVGKTGHFNSNFCDGYASRFRSNVAEAYLDHTRGVPSEMRGEKVCDQ
jgi:uncharacterized protein